MRHLSGTHGYVAQLASVYQRLSTDKEITRPTGEALVGSSGITLSPARLTGIRTRGGWASVTLVMLNATANRRKAMARFLGIAGSARR